MTPEVLWGVGALVLLAVMVWAATQYHRRNKANDPLTEAATREEYSHPDTYPETRERLKEHIRPS
ncbi:hypothetical protein [Phenylobacterium kunshanense]|jgi:hypothetical protein|uniref:Uncharacterized protein n=1 Tax=Phenylobacterium kunshanense TaxID=1445034 RepID=A0A328BHA4_9CAUL|nr:hypothetical protein [Phenylobacterium kunshanense]RAK65346.1 hypothetical protein DJ019_10235 [Phenylobacterium kunshanense]